MPWNARHAVLRIDSFAIADVRIRTDIALVEWDEGMAAGEHPAIAPDVLIVLRPCDMAIIPCPRRFRACDALGMVARALFDSRADGTVERFLREVVAADVGKFGISRSEVRRLEVQRVLLDVRCERSSSPSPVL